MKRKKIIQLLLALSLSSSVFSFGPTWGEPANESGNPFLTEGNRLFHSKQQYGFYTL